MLARGLRSRQRYATATNRQLLNYSHDKGRIPAASPDSGVDSPVGRIERTYEHFLINERGLSSVTVVNYLPIVHVFLAERFETRAVALERLSAQDANRLFGAILNTSAVPAPSWWLRRVGKKYSVDIGLLHPSGDIASGKRRPDYSGKSNAISLGAP